MSETYMVELDGVTHHYGSLCALDQISFKVPKGAIFGLIGPNGSGKSTTLNLLTTLLTPGAGTIKVAGYDLSVDAAKAKARIGYAPEEANMYQGLSPREFGILSGALHGMSQADSESRVDALLETFLLTERRDDYVGGFSKGMKRKSLLVSALVHDPDLLILDEPLDGLDVIAQKILKDMIKERAAQGATVIYSTHILEVLDGLCTHVLLLKNGKVLVCGALDEVRNQLGYDDLGRAFHGSAS